MLGKKASCMPVAVCLQNCAARWAQIETQSACRDALWHAPLKVERRWSGARVSTAGVIPVPLFG